MPELRDIPMRNDLQLYNVIKPNEYYFEAQGSLIKSQKRRLWVIFNPREGLVLGEIRYDYWEVLNGNPRPRSPKKDTFGLEDYGAVLCANSLGLGCELFLSVIHYLYGLSVHLNGNIEVRKNVACMYEEEEECETIRQHNKFCVGVDRAVRRCTVVLQTILTVANY